MKYERQTALLIDLILIIATHKELALKGGTAINLFYKDMPRLSVDLDLVFLPITPRDEALRTIDHILQEICDTITNRYPLLHLRTSPPFPELARQIICLHQDIQAKIEVNIIIRGTLHPIKELPLSQGVLQMFGKTTQMQVVDAIDLYGSKICATLDRKHPRDLFDMQMFFTDTAITREYIESFLFYLISHNRPMAEVLNPSLLDIRQLYKNDCVRHDREHDTTRDTAQYQRIAD